jgi:ribose 1,5-bisphosphate isomerase
MPKFSFEETVKKIKSLEIQGAENIAIKAIEAFAQKLKETKSESKLKRYANELKSARPTEPGLQNALKYCLRANEKGKNETKFVLNHFRNNQKTIAKNGSALIKSGMKIFTHCHSSTVERVLVEAKRQGKKIEVFNTETRPRFQGRKTAEALAKAKIPVTHCVDSAGRSLLRKCDIFLIGCDSITKSGKVINKIGTESLFDAANESGIPIYVCTNSWKFDLKETKIEERNPNEVWENPPKGVKIYNPAFEIVEAKKIKGIVTELGVIKPKKLYRTLRKKYPYIFK